ncbi:UNVERIFIED_CONTAM: hypothetical protein Sradi_3024200 [Sesamum radiatum]|uniref:Uncharacterized protein n=1 Tax=Sesamum radiatum TaxID=300843 RepID=A0AAW2S2I7_SESRA
MSSNWKIGTKIAIIDCIKDVIRGFKFALFTIFLRAVWRYMTLCSTCPGVAIFKTFIARVWARLKVLFVGVRPVDLASVSLDPWDETLVGLVCFPDLYDVAFDLDHHDRLLKEVLLELLR